MKYRYSILILLLLAGVLLLRAQDNPLKYEWGDRDERANPDYVLQALALQPGQTIVDLGAGGGYFTVLFAEAVGPAGRVIATDIKQDYLDFIENRVAEAGYSNVEYLLAEMDAPNLIGVRADVIFLANVYHHLEDPAEYLAQTISALLPGGRLVIIETYKRISSHGSTVASVIEGCAAAGFVLDSVDASQPRFFIATFKPEKLPVN